MIPSEDIFIKNASILDAEEILKVQKRAFYREANLYKNMSIYPMIETLEEVQKDIEDKTVLKAVFKDKIVASIRCFITEGTCQITRFFVDVDFQKIGLGKMLFTYAESLFQDVKRFELWAGSKSQSNLRFYEKMGYVRFKTKYINENGSLIFFEKWRNL